MLKSLYETSHSLFSEKSPNWPHELFCFLPLQEEKKMFLFRKVFFPLHMLATSISSLQVLDMDIDSDFE